MPSNSSYTHGVQGTEEIQLSKSRITQNKIKYINYFSSTNNKKFWLQAQSQMHRVQKPHAPEAWGPNSPNDSW